MTPRREAQAVAVLALGFGLVGVDRFLISTMYPRIARDLHLGYGDIGTITGALALAWGVAALVMGNLSDRIGQRRVLIGALIVFSLLIGTSGLAASLAGLIAVRVMMGLADGAFTPASIAATVKVSSPDRHGRNVGFQQAMLVLLGLGVSPLLVGALLRMGVDWRAIFLLFSLPGLLLAWATWRCIPDFARNQGHSSMQAWREVLAYRNIRLLMLGMFCWLTCLVITSAFLPSYLIDHLHIAESAMGTIMSAIGFGSLAGTILLSALSDRVGRTLVMQLGSGGALACLILLGGLAMAPWAIFACLFVLHFFNNALIALSVGPLAAETVPVALMTTASGVVIAAGELLGGCLAPVIGGQIAQHFGIEHILLLPIVMMLIGVAVSFALSETCPEKVLS